MVFEGPLRTRVTLPDAAPLNGIVRSRGIDVVRVAGKFVRKYTLRRYAFFLKEMEAKSVEFSTMS
jgi:hypothetical protein